MSHRENIVAHVATVLTAALTGAATVSRSRQAAASRAEGVVVSVAPESEEVQRAGAALVKRQLVVVITVTGRGAIPDQVVDTTLAVILATLMADQTLGGTCASITEQSSAWSYELADLNATAVELRYVITYATLANSLASQA